MSEISEEKAYYDNWVYDDLKDELEGVLMQREAREKEIASLKDELNSILEQSNIFREKAMDGHKEIRQGIKSLSDEVKTLLADKQRLAENNIWAVEEFNRIRDEKNQADKEIKRRGEIIKALEWRFSCPKETYGLGEHPPEDLPEDTHYHCRICGHPKYDKKHAETCPFYNWRNEQ